MATINQFDGPPKHAPHLSLYPVISNIRAVVSGNTATITWITDIPSTSQAAYGRNQNKDLRSPYDSTLVTSHSVVLSNLDFLALYFFNVQSFFFDSLSISPQNTFFTGSSGNFLELEDGTYILLEDGTKIPLE